LGRGVRQAGYFVGRRALEKERDEGSSWKLVGLEIAWESIEQRFGEHGLPPQICGMAVRASLPVMKGPRQVGYASTSTWSPVLKKYIALAHGSVRTSRHGSHGVTSSTSACSRHRREAPFYDRWKK
jgi:aminomethyltransferase